METNGSYRLSRIYVILLVLVHSHLILATKGSGSSPTPPSVTMETTEPTYTNTMNPGIYTFPLQVYDTIPNTDCWTSVGECYIPTNISEFDAANVNISFSQPSEIIEGSFDGEYLLQDYQNAKWFIWELVNYTTIGISVNLSHCDSDTLTGTCAWKFSFTTTAVTGPPKFSTSAAKTTLFQNLTKIPKSPSPTTTTTKLKFPVIKTKKPIRTLIAPTMACLCPCVCNKKPIPQDRMETLMKEIKEDMAINVTSQQKRRLVSASDKSMISRGIGYVGVLVMTIVFGVILIGDAKLLIHDARAALRNFGNNL